MNPRPLRHEATTTVTGSSPHLSLLEFLSLFFSFLSTSLTDPRLDELVLFLAALVLLLLLLLLLLLFFDGDLLLLLLLLLLFGVLAPGFSPARTFLTASPVSVFVSMIFANACRNSLVLSGSWWTIRIKRSAQIDWNFFIFSMLPAFLLLVLRLHFRAEWLPMIGAWQPSGLDY